MSIKLETIKFTEKSLKYFQRMDEYLLGRDLLLMLLSLSPVKGTTMLQKQTFLAWETLFKKQTTDLGFFPYKFGAYSKTIDDSITVLKNSGLITVKPAKGEGVRYSITLSGKRTINRKLKKLEISIDELKNKKVDWDEWTTRGIMKFVYRNYPEYTTKTKVPSLKW